MQTKSLFINYAQTIIMKEIYFLGIRVMCGVILFVIGLIVNNDYVQITGGLTVTLALIDGIEHKEQWNHYRDFGRLMKDHVPLIAVWFLLLSIAAFNNAFLYFASVIISFFLKEVVGYFIQKY